MEMENGEWRMENREWRMELEKRTLPAMHEQGKVQAAPRKPRRASAELVHVDRSRKLSRPLACQVPMTAAAATSGLVQINPSTRTCASASARNQHNLTRHPPKENSFLFRNRLRDSVSVL
jgi:hypothetical protein